MVSVRDEWGHDPSVQLMRRVFQQMEFAEEDRPIALERGTLAGEEKASVLYVHCLARALGVNGFTLPADVLAKDETITTFLREVLP